MENADISVIIPVYNAEHYLAEALDSVLAQEIEPLEILVVDDGSTDGSATIARRYADRVRFYQQANRGAAFARNRGIELSKGSLLAFLDADDLWMPSKLNVQVNALEDQPELDMVLGTVMQFISPEVDNRYRPTLRQALETMPAYPHWCHAHPAGVLFQGRIFQ